MSVSRNAVALFALALLGGCNSSLSQISSAANATRDASEHVAESTDNANRTREAKILADAQAMEEKAQAKSDALEGSRPRYEIRKDGVGDSWTVFDTANGRAIKVDSKTQSGLTHEQAEATFGTLLKQQKAQDEIFGRTR